MADVEAKEIKVRRYDFYPTDWLEGTIGLSHIERSIYITVIAAIYAQGGPVEVCHVRKLCGGRGFERGLESLLAKGKIARDDIKVTSLVQHRCMKEITKVTSRVHEARTNGALGGRPSNGLAKPDGYIPPARSHGRVLPLPKKERKKESSYEVPVAARAYVQREAAVHAHDDTEIPKSDPGNGWQSLGSTLGAQPGPPPLPEDLQRNRRIMQHTAFLHAHGGPQDVQLYIDAQMSQDPSDGQRMFDLTEEWITDEGWNP